MIAEFHYTVSKIIDESEAIRERIMEHIHVNGLEVDNGAYEAWGCMGLMEQLLKNLLEAYATAEIKSAGLEKMAKSIYEGQKNEVQHKSVVKVKRRKR